MILFHPSIGFDDLTDFDVGPVSSVVLEQRNVGLDSMLVLQLVNPDESQTLYVDVEGSASTSGPWSKYFDATSEIPPGEPAPASRILEVPIRARHVRVSAWSSAAGFTAQLSARLAWRSF